jgi:glycolate oxidase iron-sulfur subunit
VQYGRLADIGRRIVEERTVRSVWERMRRGVLSSVLPRRQLFGALLALGRMVRPLLPGILRDKVPPRSEPAGAWPAPRHRRRMLALAGCVQPALAPAINAAAARVLDRIGISLLEAEGAGCCGALRFHLNKQEAGKADMRALIDAWWPSLEHGGAEAIAMTASGCGVTVEEYAHLFEREAAYRHKAARVSLLARDIAEVIAAEAPAVQEALAGARRSGAKLQRVAFQSPCTLQHGQKIRGTVEKLLQMAGYELTAVPDAHLCCGSAGTYSVLQPQLATQLRERKLAALASGGPEVLATANIGCLAHLQAGTRIPVRHWIQLLDDALQG